MNNVQTVIMKKNINRQFYFLTKMQISSLLALTLMLIALNAIKKKQGIINHFKNLQMQILIVVIVDMRISTKVNLVMTVNLATVQTHFEKFKL